MKEQTLTAHAKYDDLLGTVAADHHDSNRLCDLARELGVDTNRHFIFGVHVYFEMENSDDLNAKLRVDLLAVNALVVGASFDSIRDFMRKNDGKLPYARLGKLMSFQEVLTAFKRFDLVLTMNLGPFQDAFEEDSFDLGRIKS
jgi:hypothetical protein